MNEHSKIIIEFVEGDTDVWEWDDFISTPAKDKSIQLLKRFCSDIQVLCPSFDDSSYCSPVGVGYLLAAAKTFESGPDLFEEWLKSNHSEWFKSTFL